MNQTIIERVASVLKEIGIRDDAILPESHLKNDYGLDDCDIADFLLGLEGEFDCVLSDADCDKIHCVSDAVKIMEKKGK